MLTLLLAVLLAVLTPIAREAQPAAKPSHRGAVANALDAPDGPPFRGLVDGLRSLGDQDRNVVIEWRSSEGDDGQLPELAADLVRAKVDVLFATSLRPARAAVQATKTVPIVFVVSADPVALQLVASLARPGGNATGLAVFRPQETSERVLQLLKTAVPTLSLLAVLTNPENRVQREIMAQALPAAAQRAKVTLMPLAVQSPADISAAFDGATRRS